MQAIGLTMKNVEENPFTGRISGELMIIHRCLGCGVLSVNRIAGDDDPYVILSLIDEQRSDDIDHQLMCRGITVLTKQDEQCVKNCLFGVYRF